MSREAVRKEIVIKKKKKCGRKKEASEKEGKLYSFWWDLGRLPNREYF